MRTSRPERAVVGTGVGSPRRTRMLRHKPRRVPMMLLASQSSFPNHWEHLFVQKQSLSNGCRFTGQQPQVPVGAVCEELAQESIPKFGVSLNGRNRQNRLITVVLAQKPVGPETLKNLSAPRLVCRARNFNSSRCDLDGRIHEMLRIGERITRLSTPCLASR